MQKIIGLGATGCAIAQEFSHHPEYDIYRIGTAEDEPEGLQIPYKSNIEDYESEPPSSEIASYLRNIQDTDEVLFILQGGEPISGLALVILETIRESHITILYVCPEEGVSTQIQQRDHKIVGSILQEYARSGVFAYMHLVDSAVVDSLVGDVPLREYEREFASFVCYVVAMINDFTHTDAVITNYEPPPPIFRIATWGTSTLGATDSPRWFFPLGGERVEHYYFGIPEGDLTANHSLLREVKEQVKTMPHEAKSASFSVHPVTLDAPLVLCAAYSKTVQSFPRVS